MNHRLGSASRMLPLLLIAGLIAGCGQGGRQAAEASSDALSAASPSAQSSSASGSPSPESSSVGAFVNGSRICIINKSAKNFQIEPMIYKERSKTTSVDPGDTYCQAGYVEGSLVDTELRAISGPTTLHITAHNTAFVAPDAMVKFIDNRGNYERPVVWSDLSVNQEELNGVTPDEGFALHLFRVDNCCGWIQWRLEIFDVPTE